MVKDEEELQRIREAARLGSSLVDTALQAIRPGVSEIEVAAEMEYDARQKGAEAMSFDTIVASGARSALPHGRASAATIRTGSSSSISVLYSLVIVLTKPALYM